MRELKRVIATIAERLAAAPPPAAAPPAAPPPAAAPPPPPAAAAATAEPTPQWGVTFIIPTPSPDKNILSSSSSKAQMASGGTPKTRQPSTGEDGAPEEYGPDVESPPVVPPLAR